VARKIAAARRRVHRDVTWQGRADPRARKTGQCLRVRRRLSALNRLVAPSGHDVRWYSIDAVGKVRVGRIERQTVNMQRGRQAIGQIAKRVDHVIAEFVDGTDSRVV
jgi:hypothetical protein